MIVHYIGGPRDGEREALSELRSDRLMFPVAPPIHHYVRDEVPPSLVGHIETAEYRVIKRERYAIAEFVEPKITTRWAVTVKVSDRCATDTVVGFHDWLVRCSREFGLTSGPRAGTCAVALGRCAAPTWQSWISWSSATARRTRPE